MHQAHDSSLPQKQGVAVTLQELKRALGATNKTLAEFLGVPRSTVSHYMTGRHTPTKHRAAVDSALDAMQGVVAPGVVTLRRLSKDLGVSHRAVLRAAVYEHCNILVDTHRGFVIYSVTIEDATRVISRIR